MATERTSLIVPLRDLTGMTRLAGVLDEDARAKLTRTLAERLTSAAQGAGMEVHVVTADDGVAGWASSLGANVVDDPGDGLDAAAAAGISLAGGRWIVAHADLPLVTADALATVDALACDRYVLVPSLDGGTNVVAGSGAFRFAYGPGSFHRHLAAHPTAAVCVAAPLSVDVDTPRQLAAVSRLSPSLIDA